MWRGLLGAGVFFAFLGGIVVLVVMGSAAGCSGGYNCTPNTIAMSIGVLLTGLGFLLVVVAFGMRPSRGLRGAAVASPPPYPSPTAISGGRTLPGPFRFLPMSRLVLLAILLFFLGLLVSAAGYLEFFSGDWFNSAYATWNYPNGWAGVAVMAIGWLMWLSALVLVTVAAWREPRAAPPAVPMAPSPPSYPWVGTETGGPTLPLPPPPSSYYPPPPPPPPGPYPPGAG